MMKKILTILFITITIITQAQSTALLRLKYKQGDTYKISMQQNINSAAMAMKSSSDLLLEVKSVTNGVFDVAMKIDKMTMDMMQGGMQMQYDSTKKDEELDETGKMIKMQMAPMLSAVISTKMDVFGKSFDTKITPNVPGVDQFLQSSTSIEFPKEKVYVGYKWNDVKEQQGVKTTIEYEVAKITTFSVFLNTSGKISGMGSGTLKGTIEIDRRTGNPIKSSIKSAMVANGQDMKVDVNVTTTRI